jgi:sugar phosphate isomerase/epimerase
METLFEDRAPTGQRARFTSYVDELNAIVFAYNTPSVGICWDFGHARVSYGAKQFEEMKNVGNKISSTHAHDNRQKKDLHLIPFLGDTDWELGLKTLKEVGYTGDLTFELGYGSFPEELITDYINLVYKIGKFMVDKFNNF